MKTTALLMVMLVSGCGPSGDGRASVAVMQATHVAPHRVIVRVPKRSVSPSLEPIRRQLENIQTRIDVLREQLSDPPTGKEPSGE